MVWLVGRLAPGGQELVKSWLLVVGCWLLVVGSWFRGPEV